MHKMYTKQFFQKFVELWESTDAETMSNKLGIERGQVNYIAAKIRKAGYALTRKRQSGEFQALLKEALDEISFPRTRK